MRSRLKLLTIFTNRQVRAPNPNVCACVCVCVPVLGTSLKYHTNDKRVQVQATSTITQQEKSAPKNNYLLGWYTRTSGYGASGDGDRDSLLNTEAGMLGSLAVGGFVGAGGSTVGLADGDMDGGDWKLSLSLSESPKVGD